jgi:hypothetical protein
MVFLIANADEIAKGCGSRATNILPACPVRKQVHEKAAETGFAEPGIAGLRPEPGRFRTDRALFDAFSYAVRRLRTSRALNLLWLKPDRDLIPLLGHDLFGEKAGSHSSIMLRFLLTIPYR